jgi:hypothetical protein
MRNLPLKVRPNPSAGMSARPHVRTSGASGQHPGRAANLSITRQYECAHRPRKIADVRDEALAAKRRAQQVYPRLYVLP